MSLNQELGRIAVVAARFADAGETLAGILPAEAHAGERVYVCVFAGAGGDRSWLALDGAAQPVGRRAAVRDAVSIAAMCEVAEETAGGGDLDDLLSQLVALRLTEDPPGIAEAEEAVLALQRTIGSPPRVATPSYLDAVGAATRRLERILGEDGRSPFAEAMKGAVAAIDSLTAEVEAGYKVELD